MRATYAKENEEPYSEIAGCGVERALLYLILAAGYAFLGFFGWLLTL